MKPLFGTEECYKLYLSDNYDRSNEDIIAEVFTFPGGEPHVKITDAHTTAEFPENFHNLPIRIYHVITSFNDLGVLFMTVDALRRANVWKLSLVLPYFPGARQDRVAEGIVEPLSVKVYADLINSLSLDEVIIFDPHSEVAPALINNCVVLNNHKFVASVCSWIPGDFCLVSPDAGAAKKIEALAKSFPTDAHVEAQGQDDILYFRKQRDMKTGILTNFVFTNKQDLKGIDCVIVDDICDGGRTFIEIAKVLKENNAGNIHLIVSHGIFSAGIAKLFEVFETITTTNSWHIDGRNGIKVIDLVKLYNL